MIEQSCVQCTLSSSSNLDTLSWIASTVSFSGFINGYFASSQANLSMNTCWSKQRAERGDAGVLPMASPRDVRFQRNSIHAQCTCLSTDHPVHFFNLAANLYAHSLHEDVHLQNESGNREVRRRESRRNKAKIPLPSPNRH